MNKSEKTVLAVMRKELPTKAIYYAGTSTVRVSIEKAIESLKVKGVIKIGSEGILCFVK